MAYRWDAEKELTVLKQMAKSIQIQDADPEDSDDNPGRLLASAKWSLWHGNVHESMERLDTLIELVEPDPRVQDGPERKNWGGRSTNSRPIWNPIAI